MKKICFYLIGLIIAVIPAFSGTEPTVELQPQAQSKDENSRDLFELESTYTLESDFKDEPRLGHYDSFYNDFTYDHRFLIKGNWFFRAGVEYERFDFDGSENGLPEHLQAFYGHLAVEYVVKDHAGAGIELDPGIYYQNHISGDAFDIPWKVFVSFPLKKDKVFGVIGLGGGIYQDPIVAPGGGLIWLISEKVRLEGVFPKPALVYNPTDDWQFRILGNLLYRDYRTDDVITPLQKLRLHDAIVQYNEDRAGLQASYSGFEPFKISAGVGCNFSRNFDFFRAGVRAKLDPSPYFDLIVEAKF
jgi:hypothetical protein